jgi:hypothetical protein
MGKRQYSVSLVADRIGELRECRKDISEINGRVVRIVWQPRSAHRLKAARDLLGWPSR